MRYPTREYQCANRRRTLPLGQAFNLIATRVLDSVVHINGCECAGAALDDMTKPESLAE